MKFWLLKISSKYSQVHRDSNSQSGMGTHLGVWGFIPSHSPTLPRAWNVTPGLQSWLAPLQALAMVVSPRLGLRHWETLECNYFVSVGGFKSWIWQVYSIESHGGVMIVTCEMTIRLIPNYTCLNFEFMLADLKKKKNYVPCKHLYFIFKTQMFNDHKTNDFIN
jgi:hypothetical protein